MTQIVDGPVRVAFEYIGEGVSGDYNDTDPRDEPLLRLDAEVRADSGYEGEPTEDPDWLYPDQGSICTQVREDVDPQEEMRLLRLAAKVLREAVESGHSVKHAMDRLSWLTVGSTEASIPQFR